MSARTVLDEAVGARLAALAEQDVPERLWQADTTLWKDGDEAHQKIVASSLGWLSVFEAVRDEIAGLGAFVDELRADGYRTAVLLGMGGSSLAPEVMAFAFGTAPGYLDLIVLDTTDPAAIAAVEKRLDFESTLFIVASKSGGTTETASLHAYFYERFCELDGGHAGHHFVAITDEDTSLEKEALAEGFRAIFVNPGDIGGRYSALSFFGIVPAALMGVDLERLLDGVRAMARACGPDVPPPESPGLRLGAVLGEAALAGRDKVTLVASPGLGDFGAWVEQLVAESTGKEGKGLFPVDAEPLGPPEVYGDDRLVVYLRLADGADAGQDEAVAVLEQAGFPVVRFDVAGAYDLGGLFLLWEIAVAVAGAVIGIDAFDQPNVQESKDNTRRVLAEIEEGAAPALPAGAGGASIAFAVGDDALQPALRDLLVGVAPPAYVALQAWVTPGDDARQELQAMREALRDRLRVATSDGFGPRFLHSTGQYHKGGPAHGVFLQLVSEGGPELPVPGQPYTFGVLKHAQALGDLQALVAHGGRVLRADLGDDPVAGLRAFRARLDQVLAG
jgi:transaldolase/glucose-6-phosphate isomerase